MSTLKSLAAKLGLLVGSLFLAVLFSELCIRWFEPQVTMFPRFVESTDYGIALQANAQIEHSQGNRWRFVYTTNEIGHRGTYLPVSDHYATRNVVLLGDSFTFGYGVHDSATFADVMGRALGTSYSVINGGMGGFGIDSEIKWYYKMGRQYRPAFVLLQFTGNDPGESYTGVTKIMDSDFVFSDYDSHKPAWQRIASRSGLLQHSHLYSLLRKLEAAPKLARDKEAAVRDPERFATVSRHYVEMLRLFAHKLKEANVALLFLSVTHQHDSTYHYDINDFPIIEREVFQLNDSGMLRFVDLPLEDMRIPRGSPEGHQWSAEHHEMVGSAIAAEIKREDAAAGGLP